MTFTLQWHVTVDCDQACKHCYMYGEAGYSSQLTNPLSLEQSKAVIDDFSSFCEEFDRSPKINFTGGDPLLRKDFFELLAYAQKKEIKTGILGNPFHVNRKVAAKLKDCGLAAYQLSLDGTEATHDFFRKKGSFAKTGQAIDFLKGAGIRTKIMFTLSRRNASELQQVIDFCDAKQVDLFDFSRVVPIGNARQFKKDMLTPAQFRQVLVETFEHYAQLEHSTTIFGRKDSLWNLLYYEMGLIEKPLRKPIFGGCTVGIRHLSLLADGTVYACRRFCSPVGVVPKQKIKNIFLGSKLNYYRHPAKFEKCSKCELVGVCRGCPAVSYAVNGSFYAPDPQCWKKI